MMDELVKYLARYKGLQPPQASKVKLVVQVVQDECGILLSEKNVSIRRGGVVLSCHPTIRSELLQFAPLIISTLYKKHNLRVSFIR